MFELVKTVFLGLILFLPLTNPLTTIALLLGISGHMSEKERNRQSLLASVYVFMIMVIAFYGGHLVMDAFGISIPGLRIAGGIIVAFIGFKMLFPPATNDKITNVDNGAQENKISSTNNIAFVPLAMPSTAGPGTIAMIISTASTIKSGQIEITPWVMYASSILIPLAISVILWLCLRSSGTIMRLVGKSGIDAISRIMGFLLVCMGTQFIINGIQELVVNFPHH
ncbi:MarC family NAAT transporter [Utexia brackfieldae]|uniref:MarC family NAAT transporter n=1 Tax=Utexia brackfieldae TaxID=3074108 RepID=UPI00370D69E2